jgi:exopolysaccharide biosynthesis protein
MVGELVEPSNPPLLVMIIMTCSLLLGLGVIGYIVITSRKALKKFSRLDTAVRNKLVLLDYYMAAVRRFTPAELHKLSKLTDEEINAINKQEDHEKKLQAMRESIG